MIHFYQVPVFLVKRYFGFIQIIVLAVWVALLTSSTGWSYSKKQSFSYRDCTTPTFGSIIYEPTEIYQGNVESFTSVITGLIPNVSQTFAYSIDGIVQEPVTAISDAKGNVLDPFKYETLRAAFSSVGIHVVTLTSITIDNCTLQLTSNNSVTVTIKPAPDLTPIIYVTPTIQYGSSLFSIVVDVYELNGSPTNPNRKINVYLNKNSQAKITFDASAISIGGRSVSNSVWNFDESDPDYYILSTSAVIDGGGYLSFGLTVNLLPGGTSGIYSLGATISPVSGGELSITNNVDVDKITYFAR